jgi:hypothetical protein
MTGHLLDPDAVPLALAEHVLLAAAPRAAIRRGPNVLVINRDRDRFLRGWSFQKARPADVPILLPGHLERLRIRQASSLRAA